MNLLMSHLPISSHTLTLPVSKSVFCKIQVFQVILLAVRMETYQTSETYEYEIVNIFLSLIIKHITIRIIYLVTEVQNAVQALAQVQVLA